MNGIVDQVEVLAGVPIVLVTPALVEVAKQLGLPLRFAGVCAMMCAVALLALGDLATGQPVGTASVARWLIGGMVYGLAAVGLYTQSKRVSGL